MYLVFEQGSELRYVRFDATIHEQHSGTALVPEHPVEGTVNISDDAVPELRRLSVEVMTTNTPLDGGTIQSFEIDAPQTQFKTYANKSQRGETETLTPKASATTMRFETPTDFVTQMWETLDKLRQSKTIFTAVTKIQRYERMIIESLSAPVGPEDSIVFTLDLREIAIAESTIVDAPQPIETRGNSERNRGGQATEENTTQTAESLAHAAVFNEDGTARFSFSEAIGGLFQ